MGGSLLRWSASLLWRRRWLLGILSLLLAAYAAAGFFLVPYIARSAIERYVRMDLARKISIGQIRFNPFTLTVEVTGFALSESDGAPIASFDRLRVNTQISSIVTRTWTFKEVLIEKPDLRLQIETDGSLNLAKLQPNGPTEGGGGKVPALRIGTFAIHAGQIAINDRSRATPFATTLSPIEFTLTDFRTAPDFQNAYSFSGSTLAGERLNWSGAFAVQPLNSTGRFSIAALKAGTIASYLQDTLPFALPSGTIDVEGTYRVLLDGPELGLELPTLRLRDLRIAAKGADSTEPWIGLPSVVVTGTKFSLAQRTISIARIESDNSTLKLWREPDGQLNLQKLMGAPVPVPPSAPSPAPAAATASWNTSVGEIDIRAASIEVEDRTTEPAAKLSVTPLTLTLSGYSSAPDAVLKLDASFTVGGKGQVAVQGGLKLQPMTADLTIDAADFELPPLQPYIAAAAAIELMGGQVSTKAKLDYAAVPAPGKPALQFSGDVTVSNLATRDSATRRDFINWQQLRLVGIDFRQGPDALNIARIEAQKPYGRVIISPDQTLNIVAILNPPSSGPAAGAAVQPAPAQAATGQRQKMPMRIGAVTIKDGNVNFSDFSVEPNFSAAMMALNGSVTGLTSDPNSRAEVKIAGNVDQFAPVDISGRVNLLSATVFTDIAMNFRNMELTTFNPYSGKYAGYNITKGKLTTELRYKVNDRKLDAQHHILLDQLEFGTATNSKDAVPLPVRLAVALLKDRNGLIDINLPVTGSLDDPQFRVGPIIWQAFVGLLTKIVTAPFDVLGALFGGGDELSYVTFAPGSAMIEPDQQTKIAALAKALAERPQLRLDIPLETIAASDDPPLARTTFEAALAPYLSAAEAGMPATPSLQLTALSQLYQQQTGAAPTYPMPASPEADTTTANIAFLQGELRPRFNATQSQRENLARERADAVRAAVLADGTVTPEQVFLTARPAKASADGAARMELDLQ